jgi:hypothetical protein
MNYRVGNSWKSWPVFTTGAFFWRSKENRRKSVRIGSLLAKTQNGYLQNKTHKWHDTKFNARFLP